MNIQEILKHLSTRNVNDTSIQCSVSTVHTNRATSQATREPRIVFLSTSLFAWTEKYMQKYVRITILKNSDVRIYIWAMHCLLKWQRLVYQLLSVSLLLIPN